MIFYPFVWNSNMIFHKIENENDWKRCLNRMQQNGYRLELGSLHDIKALSGTEIGDKYPSFGLTRIHNGNLQFTEWLEFYEMEFLIQFI